MKSLLFIAFIAILSANIPLYTAEYSSSVLKSLEKNESLYSAQILETNNYALVVKGLYIYNNPAKSQSNHYTLYHNNDIVNTYGEIAYYKLYNNGSITSIAKKNHIMMPMWFIKNSKSTNSLMFSGIELIQESQDKSRTIAFMRRSGVGHAVDIHNGNITEIATYSILIDSVISEHGDRFAFVVQRDDGIYYLIENTASENSTVTEHIIGESSISSLLFSQDGNRLVYKKYENGQHFIVDGDNVSLPYKEINNIVFSKDGQHLAYSYKNLPTTNIIKEFVQIPTTVTNIVITTNYNDGTSVSVTNSLVNTNTTSIAITNSTTTSIATNRNTRPANRNAAVTTNYNTNSANQATNNAANNNNNSNSEGYINYYTEDEEEPKSYSLSFIKDKNDINIENLYNSLLSIMLTQQASTIATHQYNPEEYSNLGYTVTTNEVVILTNLIEVIEKEIIIEDNNEILVLNGNIVASYENITDVEFSPNSQSFLYFTTEDNLVYFTDDGNRSDGYSKITAYRYSDDGQLFSYSADSRLYINSNVEQIDIEISDIHFLNDSSILYKKNVLGRYIIQMFDYESAAYNEIISIDFIKTSKENTIARNSFVFVGRRGNKYYYVDRKKIAHGPYNYISPTEKINTTFYSIASDSKNILLLSY